LKKVLYKNTKHTFLFSICYDLTDDTRSLQNGMGVTTDPINIAQLNPEQQLAIDLAKQGQNVFITGQGGVGKSLVLKEIISHFKHKYTQGEWVALAPTGIAAVELENGETVHGFAGCGVPELVKDFNRCWIKRDNWRKVKAIIIDEISMLSGEFLDNLNIVVSHIRSGKQENDSDLKAINLQYEKEEAFGGIQMILSGDFLQLPPIAKKCYDVRDILKKTNLRQEDLHMDRGFAFQSNVWKKMNLKIIQLTHVYRQDNLKFQAVLLEIRLGKVSAKSQYFLDECRRDLPVVNGVRPTILYPRNTDVDAKNMAELGQLSTDMYSFNAVDDVVLELVPKKVDRKSLEETLWNNRFFCDCIAQRRLNLKEGAQVMLIKNESSSGMGKRLVNGSRGVVIGFVDKPNEAFNKNEKEYKSQKGTLYPVVHFHCGITKVIVPEEFSKTLADLGKCIRRAIPLKLAWAITVHKAQGMSIDYVKIDVSKVFMEGQTYVALSRARNEQGLDLRGFDPKKVRADRRALEFYDNPYREFPHWRELWITTEEAISDGQ
jgi:ATP-dependent DNA helicase PIF1